MFYLSVTFGQWENAINEVIDDAILVLSEELREIVREKRRKYGRKCRN
jgi:hypothetical protein